MLVVFLGIVTYGGWYIYEYKYHQPRLAAMYCLVCDWRNRERDEADEKDFASFATKVIAYMKRNQREVDEYWRGDYSSDHAERLDEKVAPDDLLAPGRRASRQAVQNACDKWQAKIIEARAARLEAREKRIALEKEAPSEYGLSVTDLRNKVNEFLETIKDDPAAIKFFRKLVEDECKARQRYVKLEDVRIRFIE